MRRIYLLVLAVVLVATLVGLAISEQAGYVLIAYKSFRYESSLWSFLALLAVVWLLVVLVRLVLRLLGSSGRVVNPWSRYNRRRRVQMAEHSGLRDLGEGNWPQALRHLRRAAEMGERPLMHYLGAARAANELERYDEADDLLNRAREREPDAQLLVGLTRAQLLINRGDYPQARNTLEELHGLQPQHRTVLRLMQQLYVTQHDWQALCVLLPEPAQGACAEGFRTARPRTPCLGGFLAGSRRAWTERGRDGVAAADPALAERAFGAACRPGDRRGLCRPTASPGRRGRG